MPMIHDGGQTRTQPIIERLEELVNDIEQIDVVVTGIRVRNASGYHLSMQQKEFLKCNILGNPNSDGYIVNFGGINDYNVHGHALPSATRFDFLYGKEDDVFAVVAEYFISGKIPDDAAELACHVDLPGTYTFTTR